MTNPTDNARLSPEGEKEFEHYIQLAKDRMRDACDEILGEIYIHLPEWIETDSWVNFRNASFDAIRDYSKLNRWNAQKIRESILANHREQIIADLNQDSLDRIKQLEWIIEDRERWR